jgi:hypothetical protein
MRHLLDDDLFPVAGQFILPQCFVTSHTSLAQPVCYC